MNLKLVSGVSTCSASSAPLKTFQRTTSGKPECILSPLLLQTRSVVAPVLVPASDKESLTRWSWCSHACSCPSHRTGPDGLGSKRAHRESQPAVVPGSWFSRSFRDQRAAHNKRSRKDAMDQNPRGLSLITESRPVKRFPAEREKHPPSGPDEESPVF